MSAKRAPQPDADEDDSEEWDPYDIVPDSFAYDTLADAERAAEADRFELESRPRCPACEGTRIREKIDSVAEQPNRRPENFKCWGCGEHFDTPLPPIDALVGRQGQIAAETEPELDIPTCPDCRKTDRVRAYRSVEGQPQNWKCEACNRHFNDGDGPVPEPVDPSEQVTLSEVGR